MTGTAGGDAMAGTLFDDVAFGNGGADAIDGGDGDDVLDGGEGDDVLIGGAGNDIFFVDSAGDSVTENAGGGTDEVRTALAAYVLAANLENLTAISDSAHDFRGNPSNNVVTGDSGNDVLRLQDGGDDIVLVGPATTPCSSSGR